MFVINLCQALVDVNALGPPSGVDADNKFISRLQLVHLTTNRATRSEGNPSLTAHLGSTSREGNGCTQFLCPTSEASRIRRSRMLDCLPSEEWPINLVSLSKVAL